MVTHAVYSLLSSCLLPYTIPARSRTFLDHCWRSRCSRGVSTLGGGSVPTWWNMASIHATVVNKVRPRRTARSLPSAIQWESVLVLTRLPGIELGINSEASASVSSRFSSAALGSSSGCSIVVLPISRSKALPWNALPCRLCLLFVNVARKRG